MKNKVRKTRYFEGRVIRMLIGRIFLLCCEADSEFMKQLQLNLSRLIAYCESAETTLQREVLYANLTDASLHVKIDCNRNTADLAPCVHYDD